MDEVKVILNHISELQRKVIPEVEQMVSLQKEIPLDRQHEIIKEAFDVFMLLNNNLTHPQIKNDSFIKLYVITLFRAMQHFPEPDVIDFFDDASFYEPFQYFWLLARQPFTQDFYATLLAVRNNQRRIQITMLTPLDSQACFYLNGEKLNICSEKSRRVEFYGINLANRITVWLDLPNNYDDDEPIELFCGDKRVIMIPRFGKSRISGVESLNHLVDILHPGRHLYSADAENLWLFIDRADNADDNAEHFYRYVKNNHPDQAAVFVLSRKSSDWERLKVEGFNLIPFGTEAHRKALKRCSMILSSHLTYYVRDYLGRRLCNHKKLVFLQHGIIKDDLSSWLNSFDLDLFVTSSKEEHHSISHKNSPYFISEESVVRTGLPRHDALVENIDKETKSILIMPTWRRSLVDRFEGSEWIGIDNFQDTDYFKNYQHLINSQGLKELAIKHNYRIIFSLHPNFVIYKNLFTIPSWVEFLLPGVDESYQSLFKQSSLMITDYSSVALEMAVIKKPVIYYQFDESSIFSGTHTYSKGYFDYRENGFGPVVNVESELLSALENFMMKGHIQQPWLSRLNDYDVFRDGNNCKRLWEEIKNIIL